MKMTYLEIVQQLLSELESDEVTSLNQTVESEQITNMVKQVYTHIIAGRTWPHLGTLFRLEEISPNILRIPESIGKMEWVKYNKMTSIDPRNRFTKIRYMEPERFMATVDARNHTDANIDIIILDTININMRNDKQPDFWTSFNDRTIVFDSYNLAIEGKLDIANTQCFGYKIPTVTVSNGFYFDLPPEAYPYFINECRAMVFNTYKQMPHPKAEQMAQTQRRRMSWEKNNIPGYIKYPNYGRRPHK